MDVIMPGLAGQKGLKGEILLELKRSQPLAAKEFADRFGVSANAVRRHLKELEAEGLIRYGREQRGTGAPTFAFSLSNAGEALFPNRYEEALKRLLEHVMQHEGREAAVSVLEQQYVELGARLGPDIDAMGMRDKVLAMARVLEEAGFMAEREERDGRLRLTIHNCPLRVAASCLPEVCDTELNFLEQVLHAPLERGAHIMEGCNTCEYVIKDAPLPQEAAG